MRQFCVDVGNPHLGIMSGLPVTRPAIRIGPLGIPRLLDEYIGDDALVETTKRILVEILVREPFVGGNRRQASRPDETRSRTRNCQCAAYIRIARKGIHFMSYSPSNSVPSPGITSMRLIKLRVCFQWTIRKAVAWSFRYKSWRTKYHTARRLALGVPCSASSGL
jgi:hypothetical protein